MGPPLKAAENAEHGDPVIIPDVLHGAAAKSSGKSPDAPLSAG